MLVSGYADAGTLTVVNTDDSGPGSLRQALLDADASAGTDVINFDIPGGGPHTIQNETDLPTVSGGVLIDGLSQSGASCDVWPPTLMIEVTGGSTTEERKNGLELAGNATVRGIAINGYERGDAIRLVAPGNSHVECSYIGTDVSGASAISNSRGVVISGFDGASSDNVVGGTSPMQRNLISGNRIGVALISGAEGNFVQGNYIGTDAAGTAAVPNEEDAILTNFSDNNVIGGAVPGAGNLVSGNRIDGITIGSGSEGNRIEGNRVGVDATGLVALPNQTGVSISGDSNVVGGASGDARNVVSGNSFAGISVSGFGVTVQGNYVGVDVSGSGALGNGGTGVSVSGSDSTIGGVGQGMGNVIANNDGVGVSVSASFSPTERVSILGNDIYANTELGIDLISSNGSGRGVSFNDPGDADTGANGRQNFPRLNGVPVVTGSGTTAVSGSLDSTPNSAFRLEFFASETCDASRFGQGERYFGSLEATTDGQGIAAFSETLASTGIPGGWFVTATATSPDGSTSEFSQCEAVPGSSVVTNTNDSGEGSLRDAIDFTNADPDAAVVTFNIDASTDPGCDSETGVCTISPASGLPSLKAGSAVDGLSQPGASCSSWPPQLKIVIDGSGAGSRTSGVRALDIGSRVAGLVVNGFDSSGIFLGDQGNHAAECNFVGTDVNGTQAIPNDFAGISLAGSGNRVGGVGIEQRNLVSGNEGFGVYTRSASLARILGNYVGTDVTGGSDLGNGTNGIHLELNFNSNEDGGHIVGGGAPNVVAYNGANGIEVTQDTSSSTPTTRNRISRNSTFSNVGRGIVMCSDSGFGDCDTRPQNDAGDADEGANNQQNFPDITAVSGDGTQTISVTFSIDSAATNSAYPITAEFFVADADEEEGQTYLGSVVYPTGSAQLSVTNSFVTAATLSNGDSILATATDAEGNTSEFSPIVIATGVANPPPDVIFESGFEP